MSATFTSAEDLLKTFKYTSTLSQGSLERETAILKIEKTAFDPEDIALLSRPDTWQKLEKKTANDVYMTLRAWYANVDRTADLLITSICPATEKHLLKCSQQSQRQISETPELYQTKVLPYIQSVPHSQTEWVRNILDGKAEVENILHRETSQDGESGFVITPDLKWDQTTLSSLYLLVLVETKKIKSLRDLRSTHVPLLRNILKQVELVLNKTYGLDIGQVRIFIHYQPTYYHFHLHITHVEYVGFNGITVGQAHLLQDVIDHLELDQVDPISFGEGGGGGGGGKRGGGSNTGVGKSYFERRTLTYYIGSEHPLNKIL